MKSAKANKAVNAGDFSFAALTMNTSVTPAVSRKNMLMSRRFFLLPLLLASLSAAASPLDGEWKVIRPCDGATGIYAERCSEGMRDYFWLDLWTNGDSVCGFHISTGHLGSRVDEGDLLNGRPTITGLADGAVAKVHFRSAWGATGTATIRVEDQKLNWEVLDQTEGQSWIPRQAILLKQQVSSKKERRECPEKEP